MDAKRQKLLLIILFLCIVSPKLYAKGMYTSIAGTVDFIRFKKPLVSETTYKGTGFGMIISPGIRYRSRFAVGPFGMFTSAWQRRTSAG